MTILTHMWYAVNTPTKGHIMTRLVGFDIESTGIDPKRDRIVTFSIIVKEGDDSNTHEWLIDPGVEIPQGAAEVHGITTDVAKANGDEPSEALKAIWNAFKFYAGGGVLTAYNCPFDLTMLREELKRHGIIGKDSTEVEDTVAAAGIIDPLVIDKATDPYRRGSRKLVDVADHHGFSLTNAHNSTADVEATIYLADKFLTKFSDKATIYQLMELQATSKAEQAASLSEYFKKQGREDWEVDGSWPIQP